MRLKLSTEQFPVYVIIETLIDTWSYYFQIEECRRLNCDPDLSKCYYSPGPIPRINPVTHNYDDYEDDKWKIDDKNLFTTFDEAEHYCNANNINGRHRYEVAKLYLNKRIKLPSKNVNYGKELMVLLDMEYSTPRIAAMAPYFKILDILKLPRWMDVEQRSNGGYIILPLKTFNEQFEIQIRPEYLHELTAE